MKILHMMGGGDVGGAKTHIMSLLFALSKSHEVRLVSFREGHFPTEARQKGLDVTILPGVNLVSVRNKLEALIDEMKPDVIHCHGSRANLMGSLIKRKAKVPLVSTIHSDYRLDYLGNPLKQLVFGNANRISLRRFDYLEPVADRMARLLIDRGFDPQRLFPIYNGMDMERDPTPFDRRAYLKETFDLDMKDDAVLCGIAVRLTAIKDVATAISAFAKAYRRNPCLRFLIAGDGEEKPKLMELAKTLGVQDVVHFCGWVSPIDRFFKALDINVLSSLSETFPYSVLEGVREGCCTICSNVGGMEELIDSGENGYLFEPGDISVLARCLQDVADHPETRRLFAERLYKKASERFTLSNMKERQEEIYRTMIAQWQMHRQQKRYGVVICGAYGRGNTGDDAILLAILKDIERVDPLVPVCILSRRPKETRMVYRRRVIYTFNFFAFLRELRRSQLYLNGGGSLIQDVTSSRSLYFYLFTLFAGKKAGCKVMMYGCGIGPVLFQYNRWLAAKTIMRNVDAITLRDGLSIKTLSELGVKNVDVTLAADPTLILAAAPPRKIDQAMKAEGIPASGDFVAVSLRLWKGLDAAMPAIAAALAYAFETYGLTPLFIPIEHPKDLDPARAMRRMLTCPSHTIEQRRDIEVTIGLIARAKLMIGVRLHALMFAAGQGIPVIGLSYDKKVDGFLASIGSPSNLLLQDVTEEALKQMIDRSQSREQNEQVAAMAQSLVARQKENIRKMLFLLGKEERD